MKSTSHLKAVEESAELHFKIPRRDIAKVNRVELVIVRNLNIDHFGSKSCEMLGCLLKWLPKRGRLATFFKVELRTRKAEPAFLD